MALPHTVTLLLVAVAGILSFAAVTIGLLQAPTTTVASKWFMEGSTVTEL